MSILVAYDGSDNAIRALYYSVSMAKAYQDDLILLNVQLNIETYNNKRFFNKEELLDYQNKMGQEVLDTASAIVDSSGVPYKTVVRVGTPKEEICELAKKEKVRSIVMGTRGMDPLIGKILGSVSYSVLYLAPCPVVIVPISSPLEEKK